MSWWQRLLGLDSDEPEPTQLPMGAKAFTINRPDVPGEVLGYPSSWPLFDSYGMMYRRQPAVRTVVDFLARNVAQLNPKIYMRESNTDRLEWNDHPVAELLRNPNPSTTRYAHLRDTVSDLAIYDRAYWRKMRQRGFTRALVRLPASRLTVEFDHDSMRTTYRFDGKPVSRDDLVIFHGYHPDGSEMGVSPLETLRRVLSEEWASQIHREWFWKNAARQAGTLQRPLEAPEWSPEARERFRREWESTMTGGINSGRTAILEEGMVWNPESFSPRDSQYIEGRQLTYTEVARVYAPSLVGLLGADGQKANVESYHRQLYQDVLAPILRMLQDEIDNQLLGLGEFDFGSPAYCEFNLKEKLKGSFTEELDAITTAVGVPTMTINEGRARQNLPRIDEEWADVPIQPMNVVYGGQPAVNVPVGGGEESTASSEEFDTKMADYLERQEQSICSQLGALSDQGSMSVLAVWGEKATERWDSDLSRVFRVDMSNGHALEAAVAFNQELRQKVSEAYAEGGLDAVHQVYDEARADVRLPALTR